MQILGRFATQKVSHKRHEGELKIKTNKVASKYVHDCNRIYVRSTPLYRLYESNSPFLIV